MGSRESIDCKMCLEETDTSIPLPCVSSQSTTSTVRYNQVLCMMYLLLSSTRWSRHSITRNTLRLPLTLLYIPPTSLPETFLHTDTAVCLVCDCYVVTSERTYAATKVNFHIPPSVRPSIESKGNYGFESIPMVLYSQQLDGSYAATCEWKCCCRISKSSIISYHPGTRYSNNRNKSNIGCRRCTWRKTPLEGRHGNEHEGRATRNASRSTIANATPS